MQQTSETKKQRNVEKVIRDISTVELNGNQLELRLSFLNYNGGFWKASYIDIDNTDVVQVRGSSLAWVLRKVQRKVEELQG